MARVLNLEAPESMDLRSMDPDEIAKYVSSIADEALEKLPDAVRSAGVDAVELSQRASGAEWEVEVGWSRACAKQATESS